MDGAPQRQSAARFILWLAAGVMPVSGVGDAAAQTWPVKPVRMINPFSPGGSLDLVSRTVAKSMSADLGQQVVVENRPGAVGSSRVDLQACKLEYSIVSPK